MISRINTSFQVWPTTSAGKQLIGTKSLPPDTPRRRVKVPATSIPEISKRDSQAVRHTLVLLHYPRNLPKAEVKARTCPPQSTVTGCPHAKMTEIASSPILLLRCALNKKRRAEARRLHYSLPFTHYLMISLIVPAPTVRPPSRMAKRRPFSMATGVCSVISSWMLSPGITISVPSGSFADPVTSVVRK